MSWLNYSIRRILSSIFVLFGASIVIFAIIRIIPGDPVALMLGETATPEQIETVRRNMGLHLPIWEQYFIWLTDIFHLRLGESLIFNKPIAELIAVRYPRSLQLAIMTIVFSTIIGVPLAIWGATNRNSSKDYLALFFSQFGVSVPSFWLGVLLILVFARWLNLLPPSGYIPFLEDPVGNLERAIMPVTALTVINAAIITRYLRAEMLDKLNDDYVRTAHAYGIPRTKVLYRYVLKNALIPTVTVIGIQFGGIIGGVVIVEAVFSYPGIGQLILDALLRRDYPVIQISLLTIAATFILVNLVVDLLYGYLDPRIRTE